MVILGSTGSIGVHTLALAKRYGLFVEVLCGGGNIALLNEQIKAFKPLCVVIAKQSDADAIVSFGGRLLFGLEGIYEAISAAKSALVVNALSGFFGLRPTLHAISCGKRVALANKESLVVGGRFIDRSKIIPIDSEHFSLFYLLGARGGSASEREKIEEMAQARGARAVSGEDAKSGINRELMTFNPFRASFGSRPAFKKLYLTASGGAFRHLSADEIPKQDAHAALLHPTWKMGKKITIDSASMVNKLFEVLEAYWLFGSDCIDALIEEGSLIHGLVEFWDGSLSAHLAHANMELPIAYALFASLGLDMGCIQEPLVQSLDLCAHGFCLRPIELDCYPLWGFKDLLLQKPELGIVLNGANEVAVTMFLDGAIYFGGLVGIIQKTMEHFEHCCCEDVQSMFALHEEAMQKAKEVAKAIIAAS